MIRLVLCDDQALVRSGLRMILEAQPDMEVVGEAVDGNDAIALVHDTKPDVVLMDIRMPSLDGIEATRRITSDPRSSTRILMLTTFNEDEYVYDAMRSGAAGFLLKSCPAEELLHAVRRTAAGDTLLAAEITRRLVDDYVARGAPTSHEAELARLTEREREVLTLIGKGSTNAEIATQLFLGEATVKTHVNRIFAKLGVRDRTQAVILAYESGLVRPGG
ncbi:MAG TPA: response regulator transcription factor [Acidimicrobiales bacterium]|nr:response regulator transcription factor [Acidimicrobiales bacterium]